MNRINKQRVVIAGHGSRVAASNAEFEEFVRRYQAHRPDLDVSYGYIELAEPLLEAALRTKASEGQDIRLIPLFLFASGHVKNEMPEILRKVQKDFPDININLAPAIGVHSAMVGMASDRAASVFAKLDDAAETIVVMVGRGSSNPEANGDFFKICRLLAEKTAEGERKARLVLPCFIGITDPRLPETLDAAAGFRAKNILVAPYFLFDGVLISRIRDQIEEFRKRAPSVRIALAPHLGIDNRLFEITDERVGG